MSKDKKREEQLVRCQTQNGMVFYLPASSAEEQRAARQTRATAHKVLAGYVAICVLIVAVLIVAVLLMVHS